MRHPDSGLTLFDETLQLGNHALFSKGHPRLRIASGGPRFKPVIIVGGLVGIAVVWFFLNRTLTIDQWVTSEAVLRRFSRTSPLLALGAAFGIYVIVTGLSLPGAAILSLAIGWYFGWPRALVLVSFASTTGGTLAFLISRYLFRDAIERRFGDSLATFRNRLRREGAFYLFTLRLVPVFPFFVVNLVMGLTPIRTRTFWWVSQLGMLPGTFVYVYAGSTFPTLEALVEQGPGEILSPRLITAFAALGAFPLLTKWGVDFYRRRSGMSGSGTRNEAIAAPLSSPEPRTERDPDAS